jgi:hypothetical protein
MVVQAITKKIKFDNNVFNDIISCTLSLIEGFDNFIILHVKRELNALADHWAKLGSNLDVGTIEINGTRGVLPIP